MKMLKIFERFRPKIKPNRIMTLYQQRERNYNKLDQIKAIRTCIDNNYFNSFEDFYAKVQKLNFDDMPLFHETNKEQLVAYLIFKQENLQNECHVIIDEMTTPQYCKT